MERKTVKETLKRSFSETLYLSSPGTMYTVPGEHAPPGGCRPTLHPPRQERETRRSGLDSRLPRRPLTRQGRSPAIPAVNLGGAQGAQQPPLGEFSFSSRPAADRSCRCDSPAWGWPGDGGASVPRCRTAVKRNHRDAHARADTEPAPRDRPHPPAHAGTSGCGTFQKLQGQDTSERGSSAAGRGGAPGSFPGR